MIFGTLTFRGCRGQPLALVRNIRVKSQMPITPKHAIEEKSTQSLILLPLRTIYNRTFQCETPCIKKLRPIGRMHDTEIHGKGIDFQKSYMHCRAKQTFWMAIDFQKREIQSDLEKALPSNATHKKLKPS